jgi:hypothetical protein
VVVGVDEARADDMRLGAEDLVRAVARGQVAVAPDLEDGAVAHQHGPVLDHLRLTTVVHPEDDVPAPHQRDAAHGRSASCLPAPGQSALVTVSRFQAMP